MLSNSLKQWPTFLLCMAISSLAGADSERDIRFILNASHPPTGVIFEIVSDLETDLEWALPLTRQAISRLKAKHPSMKFAVVSHGREQFGLLKSTRSTQATLHQAVQGLVNRQIPVHVCGTHAAWDDKSRQDFPDYVDVAPSGPEKIREYQRQGYALIRIEDE